MLFFSLSLRTNFRLGKTSDLVNGNLIVRLAAVVLFLVNRYLSAAQKILAYPKRVPRARLTRAITFEAHGVGTAILVQ